jgi:hypothetical protein
MADYTHTIDRWDDATGENTRIRRGFIATPELRTSELIRWTCGVGQMAKRKMLFHPDCVREKIRASQLITSAKEGRPVECAGEECRLI